MQSTDEVTSRAGISRRRFKDWRERGLVPGPVERPGRGHARGRGALYPDGTAELCRAIAETMEEDDVYRLSDAAIILWLEGYPFTNYLEDRLVEILVEKLDEVEDDLAEWESTFDSDEPVSSDHPVYRAEHGRPSMGFLNRVLSPGERSTIAYIFLEVLAGQQPSVLSSEDDRGGEEASGPVQKAMEAAINSLPDALRRRIAKEDWKSKAREALEEVSIERLEGVVRDMSHEEMEEWRDQVADALERWELPDRPRTELISSLLLKSLIYRSFGVPMIRDTNDLLARESSVGRQLGSWFRDHMLGAGPGGQ